MRALTPDEAKFAHLFCAACYAGGSAEPKRWLCKMAEDPQFRRTTDLHPIAYREPYDTVVRLTSLVSDMRLHVERPADVQRKIENCQLTYLAEQMGGLARDIIEMLLVLLRHEDAVVREGAVYGLDAHRELRRVGEAMCQLIRSDPSPAVRLDAADDSGPSLLKSVPWIVREWNENEGEGK